MLLNCVCAKHSNVQYLYKNKTKQITERSEHCQNIALRILQSCPLSLFSAC